MRRFIEVVVFSAEFAFWAGCCFLEKLCSRFYTKLVCCYETDPLSLVNCRHFVFGRLSARSSCSLFPNRNGHGGGGWGISATHLWTQGCTSSAVEATEVAAIIPSCLCFLVSILASISSLLRTQKHHSCPRWITLAGLSVYPSSPLRQTTVLLCEVTKLSVHSRPLPSSAPHRVLTLKRPHCTCPSASWGLFLLDNIK